MRMNYVELELATMKVRIGLDKAIYVSLSAISVNLYCHCCHFQSLLVAFGSLMPYSKMSSKWIGQKQEMFFIMTCSK